MMKDQYANYVVQKMLDVVDDEQRVLLVTKIKPHLQSLKRFTYGRHLLLKVEKLFQLVDIDSIETIDEHQLDDLDDDRNDNINNNISDTTTASATTTTTTTDMTPTVNTMDVQ